MKLTTVDHACIDTETCFNTGQVTEVNKLLHVKGYGDLFLERLNIGQNCAQNALFVPHTDSNNNNNNNSNNNINIIFKCPISVK